jgi:hypothetical protein
MALVSLDADTPPMYFGRRDDLIRALGRDLPQPADDRAPEPIRAAVARVRHGHYNALSAVIKELIDAGAIERVRRGRPGYNARYALRLLWTASGAADEPPRDAHPSEWLNYHAESGLAEDLTVASGTSHDCPYENSGGSRTSHEHGVAKQGQRRSVDNLRFLRAAAARDRS